MTDPVVKSLLETDLYKFTMWQAFLHAQPGAVAEYDFRCRGATAFPLADLLPEVEEELDRLCDLSFAPEELSYLAGLRYIKSDFVDFLSLFRFQRRFVRAWAEGESLRVRATGPVVHVMGFEIFVLYVVSELYFRRLGVSESHMAEARRRLDAKIAFLAQARERGEFDEHPFVLFDFGLRRRVNGAWHREVLEQLSSSLPEIVRGTSDVHLARTLGLVPAGTMAHEYLQAYQAFGFRLRDFQKAALEGWVQEYRGDLGVALTDVVGMDAFLGDFDLYFGKLFDGLRHDSGDPVEWGEKALAHYAKLRIDPRSKSLIFSDALDLERALDLHRRFRGRIRTGFGIGTHLTNDTPLPALNLVMKMTSCNGQPVAKISDAPGKTLCEDATFLAYLRQVFSVREAP
jgi:nicotinate phosphoribosyltransferase